MTTIRLNVSPGQSLRFNPLGKNRVQGQIDLATLGQPFLSEHSINIEAVSTTCNDRVAVIHKCEVGANGEFSFEHLGAGIYRLRISAVQLDDNEIIEHAPRRYPWLTCGFEFESREPETEKNLGLIPCVFAEYDRYGTNRIVEPIGDMNSNRDVDDFKNEQPIRFVTIKKNWPSQDITFWNSKGEALRTISKKSVSMFERNIFEQFEFARNKSRFFLSAIGEITSYDFYGTRVWDTKWNGWYKLGIAGLHGDDLQVYQPLIMSSISLLPQDSLRLQETTVPLADCTQCKFSERDGLYWSLGKKLRSFDKAGKLISNVNFLNLHALYAYGNQLSLDEVNGGCWCICIEHTFNGDVQTLNRFDSSGKLKFSKYLPPPKSPKLFPMAVAGGNCYVGESNRVVGFAPDGQNLSELPIDAKSIAATSDTNTLWALTKDGFCKIDTSGHSMVVTETIPGITGDQLFILD